MSHHSLEWDNASLEPRGKEEDKLGFMLTTQMVLYDSDDDDQSEEYVKIKKSTANWVNSFLKVPGAKIKTAYNASDEENDGEVGQYDDQYEESEDEEEAFYKQLYKDIDEDMVDDYENFIREPKETIATYISRLEERIDLYLMAKPWLKEDIKTVNVWNKFYSYVLNPELRELCNKKNLGPDQLSSAIQLAQNFYSTSNHPVWGTTPLKSKDESWASLTEKEINKNNSNKNRKQKTKASSTMDINYNGNDDDDKLNSNTRRYAESTNSVLRGARGRSKYNTNDQNNQTSIPEVPKGFENRLDFSRRDQAQNKRRGQKRGVMARYSSSDGNGSGIHSRLSYSDTGINRNSFHRGHAMSSQRGTSRHQYVFNRGSQRQAERATEPSFFGHGPKDNTQTRNDHGWTEDTWQHRSYEFDQRNHNRGRNDHWWAEESMYRGPSGNGHKYNAQDRERHAWAEETVQRVPSNRGRGNSSRGRNRQDWYDETNLPDGFGYRHGNDVQSRYGHTWAEKRMQQDFSVHGPGFNSQSLDAHRWNEEAMQPDSREYGYKNHFRNRDGHRWTEETLQHVPSEFRQRNNMRGRNRYGLAEWTMQLGPSDNGRLNNTNNRNGYRWTEECGPSAHRHHDRSRGRGRGRGRGSTTVNNIPPPKKQCYWCKEESHKSSKCPVYEKVQEHIQKKNRTSSSSETA